MGCSCVSLSLCSDSHQKRVRLVQVFKLIFDTKVLKLQMDSLGLGAKENETKLKMILFSSENNFKGHLISFFASIFSFVIA